MQHLILFILILTLCYKCQTWTLTIKQKQKLTTTELRCLRKAAGVTRRGRVRNDDVRKKKGGGGEMDQSLAWLHEGMTPTAFHIDTQLYGRSVLKLPPCKITLSGSNVWRDWLYSAYRLRWLSVQCLISTR
ncbi:hypothetical protein BsWGS_04065 [Bradybaena similaris]